MGPTLILALLLQPAAPDRAPEVTGRIVSVIPDGPSSLVSLRTTGGTLKDRPHEALVYLLPETKIAYYEIPLTQQKPEPGMFTQVWLFHKSRDRVEFVRFAREEKAFPKPAPPPPPPTPPPPPPVPTVTVEAEEMDLRGLAVKELGKAKAIYFNQAGSRAKRTIKLRKGKYDLQVFMQGSKAKHDTVVVKLAGREFRLAQEKWGTLAPGVLREKGSPQLDIPNDGEFELRIEFAESEVHVDRIVLAPAARKDF